MIKAGDKVRIRTWEEMEEIENAEVVEGYEECHIEFGDKTLIFTEPMESLSNLEGTVSQTYGTGDSLEVILHEFPNYVFTIEMIEEVEEV